MLVPRPSPPPIILLLLVVVSTAFTPPKPHVAAPLSTPRNDDVSAGLTRAPFSPSPLFMNKKKKRRPRTENSKGFGGGSSSSSSSSLSGGTTLIKPKTTSNFRYAGSIRPGLQTPKRFVPDDDGRIKFPDYAQDGLPKNRPALFPWVIEVKKPNEIEKMRAAGRCAREVLDLAGREVRPGITT